MHHPDLAEVIERARKAREVRNSEAFLDTVNDLSAFFLSQIAACPPTEAGLPALREAHLMHTAIAEIVSHLDARILAGDEAERNLAASDGEEEIDL